MRYLLLLITLLPATLWSQLPQTEPENQPIKAQGSDTSEQKQPAEASDNDDFKPSEEISEDFAIPLPSDI